MTSEEFRTDPLLLRNQFKTDGVFDIPIIKRTKVSLDGISLIGYDKLGQDETEKIVHFFLDDYKFETIWKSPESHVEKLKAYRAILSPQFSLFSEMPLSLQIYNTFRNRWCGAFFQSKGIKVIPSLAWGNPNTFWFCFDGIPKGSIVAVSTVGVRKEKALFMQGYKELQRRIDPSAVICYGDPFPEMTGKIIPVDYAETNHLKKWYKRTGESSKELLIHQTPSCIKGSGSAGGGGGGGTSLPIRGQPNSRKSLYRDGQLKQERYYDDEGRAWQDVDYTDHGNPAAHPNVPHKHTWDWTDPENPIRGDAE